MKYYILNKEVDKATYNAYMIEFEIRKNYIQQVLNGEITIDDVPEKYQEEVKQTVLDSTVAERAEAYNILMGVSE